MRWNLIEKFERKAKFVIITPSMPQYYEILLQSIEFNFYQVSSKLTLTHSIGNRDTHKEKRQKSDRLALLCFTLSSQSGRLWFLQTFSVCVYVCWWMSERVCLSVPLIRLIYCLLRVKFWWNLVEVLEFFISNWLY